MHQLFRMWGCLHPLIRWLWIKPVQTLSTDSRFARGSVLDEVEHVHHDHFTDIFPDTNWTSCLEHAKKLGLGTDDYELIQI